MTGETPASPVSFHVNVRRLPKNGMPVTVEADETQRQALAAEHDLLSVEAFAADLLVSPWKKDGVRVSGRVNARITQACVVTLEPVETVIDEDVSALFVPEGSRLARREVEGGEMVLDAEGPDLPEPFHGDTVDVGALAEEIYALAIDPYPRKEGAEIDPGGGEADAGATDDTQRGPMYESLKKLGRKS